MWLKRDPRLVRNLMPVWTWTRLIGEPLGVAGLATAVSFVANAILLRRLSEGDAGSFYLLVAVLQTLAMIANLGQSGQVARLYSQASPGHFDWVRDLRTAAFFVAPAVMIGALIASLVYDLQAAEFLFIVVGATALQVLYNSARILASQRHYALSSALLRLPNSLMIVPALAMLIAPSLAGRNLALASQISFVALAAGLGVGLLLRLVTRGTAALTTRERVQGLALLLSRFTLVGTEQGLIALAGALVAADRLAGFAALALLYRPFQLLGDVAHQVFLSEFARRKDLRYAPMVAGMGFVAALLAGAALLLVPGLSHWLYAGRYDDFAFLAVFLSVMGGFRLTDALVRGYVFSREGIALVNRFVLARAVVSALGLALGVNLTLRLGLLGTAVTGAAIIATQNVLGYAFFLYDRTRETPVGEQAA